MARRTRKQQPDTGDTQNKSGAAEPDTTQGEPTVTYVHQVDVPAPAPHEWHSIIDPATGAYVGR